MRHPKSDLWGAASFVPQKAPHAPIRLIRLDFGAGRLQRRRVFGRRRGEASHCVGQVPRGDLAMGDRGDLCHNQNPG